jgi:hypothetical protein
LRLLIHVAVMRQVIAHDLNLLGCATCLALKEQGVLQSCELAEHRPVGHLRPGDKCAE